MSDLPRPMIFRGPPWMQKAECKNHNPQMWWPSKSEAPNPVAISICNRCPVKDECLEYAVQDPECHGIWGGTSHKERIRIRRARRLDSQEGQ